MPAFVDTNILVYAEDLDEERKHPVASELVLSLWRSGDGVLSIQVLQELFVTITRKVRQPYRYDDAVRIVEQYLTWPVVENTGHLVRSAFRTMEAASLSFWDALIVAAASEAGCETLYSEDLSHGQVILGVRILDPFRDA